MLKTVMLFVAGVTSGILGGMGMGGGTVLIPILTIFFNVEQKQAQGVNLAAFIPMAFLSLIVHVKNKRVEWRGISWIILPAALTSFGGSIIVQAADGEVLKRIFGGFLTLLSFFQFFSGEITETVKNFKAFDNSKREKPNKS